MRFVSAGPGESLQVSRVLDSAMSRYTFANGPVIEVWPCTGALFET